jgi:Flp pilus assembly protein TadG
MNNSISPQTRLATPGGRRHRQRGNALIETAIGISVMVWLLLGISDVVGIFNTSLALSNAARAGAQYGSRSVLTAADTNGMIAAAKQDAPSLSTISVTATQCTCATGSTVTACATTYCTNSASRTFVTVNTSYSYNSPIKYFEFPASLTLTGKAIMQVGQ